MPEAIRGSSSEVAFFGDRFEIDAEALQGNYDYRACVEESGQRLCSDPVGPIYLPEPGGLSLLAALVLLVLLPRRGRTE